MKTQYEMVMLDAVRAKLAKAQELGIKASWTTRDHLNAVAAVITTELTRVAPEKPQGLVVDVLEECYNVSAFQQKLAKAFVKTGHFQRDGRKTVAEEADAWAAMARASMSETKGE